METERQRERETASQPARQTGRLTDTQREGLTREITIITYQLHSGQSSNLRKGKTKQET